MALHPDFPASPYALLIPEQRWFPADEALHIHDPKMAWFKSIQDIHHKMLQKDRRLALQVDVTATPRPFYSEYRSLLTVKRPILVKIVRELLGRGIRYYPMKWVVN